MELLLELSVLVRRSKTHIAVSMLSEAGRCLGGEVGEATTAMMRGRQEQGSTHATPPGCRAVLLTVLETMLRSEVE